MPYIVYKAVNRHNGKGYIGMTSRTIEQRWNSHLSAARQKSRFRFHLAIRKYGPDAWILSEVFRTDDVLEARKFEETIIAEEKYTDGRIGYNAKPGGCGGWIVPPEKYESWRSEQSARSRGSRNGNALPITNDEMIEIALRFVREFGFIPGSNRYRTYAESLGYTIPKSFTRYRFGGSHRGLAKVIEERTGLIFNPFYRDESQRRMISNSLKGRHHAAQN